MANVSPSPSLSLSERIGSIDAFRGLTMLLMLFVNDIGDSDLGNIQNAPWWLKHMPANIDGLTMADVIWPCFMFIVGLAIPLSLERRVLRGDSFLSLSWHILARAAALIVIGVGMINAAYTPILDEAATGMSGPVWQLLMYLGFILIWNAYPPSGGAKRWFFVSLRILGAGLLAYLLAIYRINEDGQLVGIQTRWWGVIGLIGWGYLIAAFLWLACRTQGIALMGAMALLLVINIGARANDWNGWWVRHVGGFAPDLINLTWPAATAVGGMVIGTLFWSHTTATPPRRRIAWMLVFAAGFAVAGVLLRPFWGIHKLNGTPSWILLSLAVACMIYALLYWLIDLKKISKWTALIAPAGSNTLLMYFLPHIFYALLALLEVTYLQTHFTASACRLFQ